MVRSAFPCWLLSFQWIIPGGTPIFEGTLCKALKTPFFSSLLSQRSLKIMLSLKDPISFFYFFLFRFWSKITIVSPKDAIFIYIFFFKWQISYPLMDLLWPLHISSSRGIIAHGIFRNSVIMVIGASAHPVRKKLRSLSHHHRTNSSWLRWLPQMSWNQLVNIDGPYVIWYDLIFFPTYVSSPTVL